jgi:hypothetical protein
MILHNLTITGKKLKELTDCDTLEHSIKSRDGKSLNLDNEKIIEIALLEINLLAKNDCSIIHVFFEGMGFFGYQKNIALLYRSDWCSIDGEFEDADYVSKESKKIYEDLKYKLKTL